jgi:hypothetical protein
MFVYSTSHVYTTCCTLTQGLQCCAVGKVMHNLGVQMQWVAKVTLVVLACMAVAGVWHEIGSTLTAACST